MKNFRKALDITIDNQIIVKGGYIQLPLPITITEEWLNAPSIADGYDSNKASVLYPLREYKITEDDLKSFIGKTIYNVPDDSVYGLYLETLVRNVMLDHEYMAPEKIQEYLRQGDEYAENVLAHYSTISELLINRVWSYIIFKKEVKEDRLMTAYKTLCTVSSLQLLLMISVLTPNVDINTCFEK